MPYSLVARGDERETMSRLLALLIPLAGFAYMLIKAASLIPAVN